MDAAGSSSEARSVFMHSLGARPAAGGIPRNRRLGQNVGGDRFIPVRSAMDFDVAHYLLTERKKPKENTAYQKILADTLMPSRHRIFAFRRKPAAPNGGICRELLYDDSNKSKKQQRQIPPSADMIVDAPELAEDYYLNLLDWGCSNVLSIALGNSVYLWSTSTGVSELMTVAEDIGPVTSVSWAPNGQHIAIGLNSSDIQLWDTTSKRLLRTLRGVHQARVGSLAWNDNILTTGGMDGLIVNNDVNERSHIVQTYQGHREEVCSLKWSGLGRLLASGGKDKLLHIWDRSMASSMVRPNQNPFLHRFEDQTAAVKALAWCPFKNNLLTSGGGEAGRSIKFWNTNTGTCLNSVDTGSQVCALLWSRNERELLSSHGFHQNQLILWKYPSMIKIAELMGHTSQVLFLAQSPDGCTVASAAGGIDETLRLWNVFGTPGIQKPTAKEHSDGPFNYRSYIRE